MEIIRYNISLSTKNNGFLIKSRNKDNNLSTTFHLPSGVWPVMLTPFDQNKKIDWDVLPSLVEHYIKSGADGLFAVCGSSEMFELSWSERLMLTEHIIKIVDKRLPVIVSGIFGDNIIQQSEHVHEMYGVGANAIILLVNQLAGEKDSEDIWIQNAEELLSKTDDIPLGLYECPSPYHRLISPELLKWTSSTNRFYWIKETSENIDSLRNKIHTVSDSRFHIFNADSRIQLDALLTGAKGYCGIATNYYSDLINWLNNNHASKQKLAKGIQQFMNKTHAVINHKYLSSAKYYAKISGVPIRTTCRSTNEILTQSDIEQLDNLKNQHEHWQQILNLN